MHEHELTKNAIAKGQILIVATSHDKLGETGQPTGTWLSELAEPYYLFKEAGFDVTIASAKGGTIPVDPASTAGDFLTPEGTRFQGDDAAMQQLQHSVPLADVDEPLAYDAIFLPGGHGPVWDLSQDAKLASILGTLFAAGKVVSAVCHGPAGLVSAKGPDGKPLVAGRKVTGFSNTEEKAVGKDTAVPWLLEDKLKELGGVYSAGPDWQSYTQVDGNLVTGQNPGSSVAVAKEVLKLLAAAKAA